MTPGTRLTPIIMENEGHTRTEYAARWSWENRSVSYGGAQGSRAGVEKLLADPLPGVVNGELVQRTITMSPWESVPDAPPAPQALFAQPKHDYSVLPGFPAEVVKETAHHNGLRFIYIGDDEETLVVLGHPTREELDALPGWLCFEPTGEPEERYARLLWACQKHEAKGAKKSCRSCREPKPGAWWLDWSVGKKKGPKANGSKAGYFPIVVWEVYG